MIIKIQDGKIVNEQEYFEYLVNLRDGEYQIKQYRRIRSLEQNRYYRGLLGIIERETGVATEEIHEKMKMKYLYVPESGVQLAYCKSTSSLKTNEFAEYIENIKNFMAEFDVILPSADQFEKAF